MVLDRPRKDPVVFISSNKISNTLNRQIINAFAKQRELEITAKCLQFSFSLSFDCLKISKLSVSSTLVSLKFYLS